MLYVVTTDYFDGAPTIGVFDSYELAVDAIQEFVSANELGKLEGSDGKYYVWVNFLGYNVTFYIEECYLNTSLV